MFVQKAYIPHQSQQSERDYIPTELPPLSRGVHTHTPSTLIIMPSRSDWMKESPKHAQTATLATTSITYFFKPHHLLRSQNFIQMMLSPGGVITNKAGSWQPTCGIKERLLKYFWSRSDQIMQIHIIYHNNICGRQWVDELEDE